MKNDTYSEEAKAFPRIYAYALSSLYRRLPLYRYPFFIRNLVRHSQEITHEVIRDYLMHNVHEFNGRYNFNLLQYLVARDVGYSFVDSRVAIFIEKHLLPKKKIHLPK